MPMREHPALQEAARAIYAGDARGLEALLLRHPELATSRSDPDARGAQSTLLHIVTGMGETDWADNCGEMARVLIEAGAEVDATEREDGGETPLHQAVSVNNVDVVRVLLDAGADPERTGRYGGPLDSALGYALFHSLDQRLPRFERNSPDLLLDHGAHLTLPFAAALGQDQVVETLLELEVQAIGSDRRRLIETLGQALLFASHHGQTGQVLRLLASGADIDACIRFFHWHCNALHAASVRGHRDTVRALLESGANPKVRDRVHGGTALDWAQAGGDDEVIALVEVAGGDADRAGRED
jgi:ankyrin repeat protein